MSEEAQAGNIPTNLVDLLDQLVLPPDPEPVSMIPQTAGWGVLGALVLIGLIFGLMRLREYRQRNAYRIAALKALHQNQTPAAVAQILRRCALAAYPRAEVASLAGRDWLAFLDKAAGGTAFTAGPGQVLATAPYRPGAQTDAALQEAARHWVRAHRTDAL